jgi:predicted Zn-dependent protease
METDSMKYRLGEVQNISHGRDAHVGFNILNANGAPIVMFSYLDRADADKARALVEQAIAGAVVVKAFP